MCLPLQGLWLGVAEDLGREHALLFVDGRPAPQGSKNAFVIGKRAVMVEASKHL